LGEKIGQLSLVSNLFFDLLMYIG